MLFFKNFDAKRAIKILDDFHKLVDSGRYIQDTKFLNYAYEIDSMGIKNSEGDLFEFFLSKINFDLLLFKHLIPENIITEDKDVAIRIFGLANKLVIFHQEVEINFNHDNINNIY